MENQTQNTTTENQAANTQQEEMMKMLAAGYDMLQTKAAQLPDMLSTAGTTVVNSVKNMSTTRKVLVGSALAVGTAVLLNKLMKAKKTNAEY